MNVNNIKQAVIKLKRKWQIVISNCLSDTILRQEFSTCISNKERYRRLRESVTPHQLLTEIQILIDERQETLQDLEFFLKQASNYQHEGDEYLKKEQYQQSLKSFSESVCSIPYFVKKKFASPNRNNSRSQSPLASSNENCQDEGLATSCTKGHSPSSQTFEKCRLCLIQSLTSRAEVLYHLEYYKLAIQDVKTAVNLNPLDISIRERLLELQIENQLKLDEKISQEDLGKLPILTQHEHSMIAHASKLARVNCTDEKGRFLEASGSIRAGDVLIVEPPYTSVLLPEYHKSHCYHCLKPLIAPVPCYYCSDVRFCSEMCQEKAFTHYHEQECKIWPFIQMVDEFCHLSLRILLTTNITQLRETLDSQQQNSTTNRKNFSGCTSDGKYKGDYRSVYSLVTNSDLQPQEALLSYALTASVAATVLSGCIFSRSVQQSQSNSIKTSHSSPNLLRQQGIRTPYPLYKLNSLADAFVHRTASNGLPQVKKSDENWKHNLFSFDRFNNFADNTYKNRSTSVCELSEKHQFCGGSSSSSKGLLTPEEIGCLLLHHLQQMSCNVHTVTTLTEIQNEDCGSIEESTHEPADHIEYKQSSVVRKEHRRIALAIYPTASLLNHACDPDVIVSFVDGYLVARATHNINPGEEITHCYGPHVGEMMRTARQNMLQKHYFFTCQCGACKRDEERERRQLCSLAILCPDCQTVLKVSYEGGTFIGNCSNPACQKSSDDVTQRLQQVQNTRELFLSASDAFELGNIRKSLTILQEVLKKRVQVLPPKDRLVVEVHDAMSRCYASLEEWALASYHCSLSTQAAEKQYGESSPEYAHELHKLAQFLYQARVGQKAMNVVERGIKLLTKLYGHDYPAVKELLSMKQCLRNFGSPVSQFSL